MFSREPPLVKRLVPAVKSAPLAKLNELLFIVTVPAVAPMLRVVAAPNALTVVAVVFSRSNDEEPVSMEVVKVGEVPNTSTPDPVSSVTDKARFALDMEFVNCPPVVVATNLSAVNPEKVMVPEEVIPVAEVIAPPLMTKPLMVLLEVGAVMAPVTLRVDPKVTAPEAFKVPFTSKV